MDLREPALICPATVTDLKGPLLRIHFDGWDESYDQLVDKDSLDIFPVSYCTSVDHPLQPPGWELFCLWVCLQDCLSARLCVFLSMCMFPYLSVCLSVCLSFPKYRSASLKELWISQRLLLPFLLNRLGQSESNVLLLLLCCHCRNRCKVFARIQCVVKNGSKLNLSYGFESRNSDTRNFIAVIQNQAAPVNLWLKANQQLKFRCERCR